MAFYAIFDGHGGKQSAEVAADMLHGALFNDPAFQQGRMEDALASAYCSTDQVSKTLILHTHLMQACIMNGGKSGCTAVTCLLIGNTMYIANVGDSECVIAIKDKKNIYSVHCSNLPNNIIGGNSHTKAQPDGSRRNQENN